jgi:hypothetical protein
MSSKRCSAVSEGDGIISGSLRSDTIGSDRSLPLCSPFLGEGKNSASLKQIRAALSFAHKHWDLKIQKPLVSYANQSKVE